MELPENIYFTKDHEWISGTTGVVNIGISGYAIEQLGDIVHIELPEPGDEFEAGDSFGTIESTKTVSDLYLPASGKIVAINETLQASPEKLHENPYGDGWLIKAELVSAPEELLSPEKYKEFIKTN